ncbi:MAG: hypothetical protein ONB48_12050 [candidate division KSB1 bacterium]|nr:hypothetical protein [candidate division KSB1 bacterium]MDZ7274004.1 hypothetical protein [candidate division KSB1 bacterium]MDZ7286377.1 hypothetical protein [candidate division KSB1 bacterium]MDZ7296605.1 hypothetical protein [candidate division KSB1 bacterium]MDZ7309019.1 hypothetical protein [candidate division KSB1 bacterium]
MNVFQAALRLHAKGSDARLAGIFAAVAAAAVFLTLLYVHFIGRHFQDRWLLTYLMPLVLLAGGLVFVLLARSAKDGYAGLAYALMAIFLLFGTLVSFLTTLLMMLWVY